MAKKPVTVAAIGASLAAIVQAGPQGAYFPEASLAKLVADGLVETNPNVKDENGNIAVRATAAGVAQINGATANVNATVETKSKFNIAAVAIPDVKRAARGRAAGGSLYPFDDLEVGQAFFVPNTEEKPNAAKSLASTVTTANGRYTEETGENETVTVTEYQLNADGTRARDAEGKLVKLGQKQVTRPVKRQLREFKAVAVEDGAAWGAAGVAGAGVWRIL